MTSECDEEVVYDSKEEGKPPKDCAFCWETRCRSGVMFLSLKKKEKRRHEDCGY